MKILIPFLLISQLAVSCAFASDRQPPNILFILVDDMGREALGAYGGESYPTPNIDRLARKGLRFDHFYAAPVCHPTRATLVSGKYLTTLGMPKWGAYPGGAAEKQTLAHQLKQAGYATGISGKWHLAKLEDDPQHPHRMGFDQYCFFGWHEGPRFWNPRIWQNGQLRNDVDDRYGPDVYYEFLEDFIRRNRKGPFFAFYSMTLAHPVSNDLNPHPPHGPHGRYMTFAEMVGETDRYVGKITKLIQKLGIAENTLIFFTTDNGTSPTNYIRHEGRKLIEEPPVHSTWKGRRILGGKKTLTDWGIRVPAIAVWPGNIPEGETTGALVDVSDIFPTFNDLAGLPRPDYALDGVSFAGLLTGKPHVSREWVFSQKDDFACVRTRNWKLRSDGILFDMANDPLETSPISLEEDSPRARIAREQLSRWLDPLTENLLEEGTTPPPPEGI